VGELASLKERIILALREEWGTGECGNRWENFAALGELLGVPVKRVRRAVRALANERVLYHGVAYDEDGRPHGSGYFFVWTWECHQPGRAGDPAPSALHHEVPLS